MKARQCHKLTVVFDLDRTLIYSRHPHTTFFDKGRLRTFVTLPSDKNPDGVLVIERPGLSEFLRDLSEFCELMIFTAGTREYAEPIVRTILPDGVTFSKIFCRENTTATKYYEYVKNLDLLNRPLEKVVILDDEPNAFSLHPRNGILIPKFEGDPNDDCLLSTCLPLIRVLSDVNDIRDYIR